MQCSLAEGSGCLFPSVLEGRKRISLAFTLTQITTNFQTHLSAANMEDKWCTMRSIGVGGATSYSMDRTTMGGCMEYVGWTSATVAHR